MALEVDSKDARIGDSADTLVLQDGYAGLRLNPAVTPWMFTRRTDNAGSPVQIRMESFDKTPLGEFIGPGAEENATRLCAMLRLCDGVGTDALHQLLGKLSEILDTDLFPSAKKMLTSKEYVLGSGERDARG